MDKEKFPEFDKHVAELLGMALNLDVASAPIMLKITSILQLKSDEKQHILTLLDPVSLSKSLHG